MIDDPIFVESLNCLKYNFHEEWGDTSLFDVFTRLLAKQIKAPGWTNTDHELVIPSQIKSEQQNRTTEQLAGLRRKHDRYEPENELGPIIIALYKGEERLLDGTTRINKWIKEQNKDEHSVNVHTVIRHE